jgi:N-acetylglucosamine-6-phosphate deacetylase
MRGGEILARHWATRRPVTVRWRDGVIESIRHEQRPPTEDLWIAPALFDPQINGFAGVDFQRDNLTVEQLLTAVRGLRAVGCSRFLLTLITDELRRLIARLRHLSNLRRNSPELRHAIAGWHIEGPFLSSAPGFHGAHDPSLMIDPGPELIRDLRAVTANDPLLLTIDPSRHGALEAVRLARRLGIVVSLGHTDASAAVLRKAVQAGATGFTHLGNACPQSLDRHDNILWRVLDTPGLCVSLIPDGLHVSPSLFRLIHRVLDRDSICYTTDAMAAAGAGPGEYTIGALRMQVGKDQVVRQPGRTNFAGSALQPIDGVFRTAQMLGQSWQKVWGGFSTQPAQFMGIDVALRSGQPADFCVLNPGDGTTAPVVRTWARGVATSSKGETRSDRRKNTT